MGSRSLVLKATAFTEWNGAGFPAHVGYVPVNVDYSDVHSILALFVPRAGYAARFCIPGNALLTPCRLPFSPLQI